MLGRTLKIAVVLAFAQLSSGCCWCWRPLFCRGWCGGCGPCACAAPCASCYTPTVAPAAPVIAPIPAVSVTPTTMAPATPTGTSTAGNPTLPFNSATYTHPVR